MNNPLGVSPSKGNQGTTRRQENIGTQSVQELFFCDRNIHRTVNSNNLIFFGCDVQQERNWEFMMYIPCYIGNGKIAKQ